jgi:hypothetical protein
MRWRRSHAVLQSDSASLQLAGRKRARCPNLLHVCRTRCGSDRHTVGCRGVWLILGRRLGHEGEGGRVLVGGRRVGSAGVIASTQEGEGRGPRVVIRRGVVAILLVCARVHASARASMVGERGSGVAQRSAARTVGWIACASSMTGGSTTATALVTFSPLREAIRHQSRASRDSAARVPQRASGASAQPEHVEAARRRGWRQHGLGRGLRG